jgi:cell division GTPase FtsZ
MNESNQTIIKILSIGLAGKEILKKIPKKEYFDYIVPEDDNFYTQENIEEIIKNAEIIIIIAAYENESIATQVKSLGKILNKFGVYTIFAVTENLTELIKTYSDSIFIIDENHHNKSLEKLNHYLQVISDFTYVDGMICIDVADLKYLLKDALDSDIGVGMVKGSDSLENSLKQALNNLKFKNSLNRYKGLLIHIFHHKRLYYHQADEIFKVIYKHITPDNNLLISLFQNKDYKEKYKITIVGPINQQD